MPSPSPLDAPVFPLSHLFSAPSDASRHSPRRQRLVVPASDEAGPSRSIYVSSHPASTLPPSADGRPTTRLEILTSNARGFDSGRYFSASAAGHAAADSLVGLELPDAAFVAVLAKAKEPEEHVETGTVPPSTALRLCLSAILDHDRALSEWLDGDGEGEAAMALDEDKSPTRPAPCALLISCVPPSERRQALQHEAPGFVLFPTEEERQALQRVEMRYVPTLRHLLSLLVLLDDALPLHPPADSEWMLNEARLRLPADAERLLSVHPPATEHGASNTAQQVDQGTLYASEQRLPTAGPAASVSVSNTNRLTQELRSLAASSSSSSAPTDAKLPEAARVLRLSRRPILIVLEGLSRLLPRASSAASSDADQAARTVELVLSHLANVAEEMGGQKGKSGCRCVVIDDGDAGREVNVLPSGVLQLGPSSMATTGPTQAGASREQAMQGVAGQQPPAPEAKMPARVTLRGLISRHVSWIVDVEGEGEEGAGGQGASDSLGGDGAQHSTQEGFRGAGGRGTRGVERGAGQGLEGERLTLTIHPSPLHPPRARHALWEALPSTSGMMGGSKGRVGSGKWQAKEGLSLVVRYGAERG